MKTNASNGTEYSRREHRRGSKTAPLLTLFASMILVACQQVQPTDAILNCFTPNMFKMGKTGQPATSYGGVGAERVNWYPQSGYQAGAGYQTGAGYSGQYPAYPGQHNPMKYLFQPKWKTGSSLFGGSNKIGWNSWRMGMNNFRPGYGYGGAVPLLSGPTVGYPFSEQLNLPAYPSQSGIGGSGSYGTQSSHFNDGWSAPVTYSNQQVVAPIQQSPISSTYEGVYSNNNKQQQSSSVLLQPVKQQVSLSDPYGGTKGGSGTKNSILMADGTGYGSYNSQLMNNLKNMSYGYTYPEWYTGVMDSPSRIAQQLVKYGLRGSRQELRNRSSPLVLQSNDLRQSSSSFTILDQPRFVGFGTVEELNNKEARLSCSFNEAIDETNRPLWIKFQGPYNSSQTINNKVVPPFNCANSQCRTLEIESTKDFRYKFDNGPATSTLIIADPRLSDYGIYRCSALTKAINSNPLETVYQVVRFGRLK